MDHASAVHCVLFSPDGLFLASGGDDCAVRLRDADTVSTRQILRHDKRLFSISFSSDTSWIATGSADQVVRVWDVLAGTLVRRFDCEDQEHATIVAFCRQKLSIAALAGCSVYVWDVSSLASPPAIVLNRPADKPLVLKDAIRPLVDGWVRGPSNEPLFWIPPEHRHMLQIAPRTMITGPRVILNINKCSDAHGLNWKTIYGEEVRPEPAAPAPRADWGQFRCQSNGVANGQLYAEIHCKQGQFDTLYFVGLFLTLQPVKDIVCRNARIFIKDGAELTASCHYKGGARPINILRDRNRRR